MKVGDLVINKYNNVAKYFLYGPRRVVKIREVDGPEGDAITLEGLEGMEFWSKYLKVYDNHIHYCV